MSNFGGFFFWLKEIYLSMTNVVFVTKKKMIKILITTSQNKKLFVPIYNINQDNYQLIFSSLVTAGNYL